MAAIVENDLGRHEAAGARPVDKGLREWVAEPVEVPRLRSATGQKQPVGSEWDLAEAVSEWTAKIERLRLVVEGRGVFELVAREPPECPAQAVEMDARLVQVQAPPRVALLVEVLEELGARGGHTGRYLFLQLLLQGVEGGVDLAGGPARPACRSSTRTARASPVPENHCANGRGFIPPILSFSLLARGVATDRTATLLRLSMSC